MAGNEVDPPRGFWDTARRLFRRFGRAPEVAGDDPGADSPPIAAAANPELEAAILAALDDPQAWLVYGDWLSEHGDPRGELIAVQCAAETASGARAKELAARAAEILGQHRSHLLGPLAAFAKTRDRTKREAFTWRRGFIHAARIAYDYYAEKQQALDVGPVVAALFSHPSGRFVQELTFGIHRADPDSQYQGVVDALVAARPASLRSLHLADFEYPDEIEMSWTDLGDLGTLWAALPGLRRLVLQGGGFRLGELALPELREAEFRTGGLSLASLHAIVNARWPRLQHLVVWFGDENYGAEGGVDDLAPLLDARGIPEVRHFGVVNAAFADAVCAALPPSRILRQLESLDLSKGTMTDAGAAALAADPAVWKGVRRLDVSENFLTPAGIERLRGLGPEVVANEQRTDEDDDGERYVAVGE